MPSHATIPDWSPTVQINIKHLIDDVQGSASAYEQSEYAVQHISVQMPRWSINLTDCFIRCLWTGMSC